jgi:hypothetical protein
MLSGVLSNAILSRHFSRARAEVRLRKPTHCEMVADGASMICWSVGQAHEAIVGGGHKIRAHMEREEMR